MFGNPKGEVAAVTWFWVAPAPPATPHTSTGVQDMSHQPAISVQVIKEFYR